MEEGGPGTNSKNSHFLLVLGVLEESFVANIYQVICGSEEMLLSTLDF